MKEGGFSRVAYYNCLIIKCILYICICIYIYIYIYIYMMCENALKDLLMGGVKIRLQLPNIFYLLE